MVVAGVQRWRRGGFRRGWIRFALGLAWLGALGGANAAPLGPAGVAPGRSRVQWVRASGPARELLPALRDRGCRVLGSSAPETYLVWSPGPDCLDGLNGVAERGPMPPEWKRSPSLVSARVGDRLLVYAHPGLSLEGIRALLESLGTVEVLAVDSAGTGHSVLRPAPGGLAAALERLGEQDEVAWLEPERRVLPNNDDSAWIIQGGDFATASTPLFGHGLTGAGQVIGIADSGLDTDACQFRLSAAAADQTLYNTTQPPATEVTNPQGKVLTYYLLSGADPYDDMSKLGHGTHVAGCAAGDDYAHLASGAAAGRDPNDGMAPAARIVFQDIGRRDGNQTGLPASLTDLFVQARDSGAHIHNDSWGKTDPDTVYSGDSREVDEAAWRQPEMLLVFSSGNLGPGADTLDGIGATAKNPIVVGASLAGASNQGRGVCHFSSQGPTADGRLRPDVVAPGAVRSALETEWIPAGGTDIFGQPTADSTTDPPNNQCATDSGLRVGTSFSAPLVAGAAALARQYFVDGFYPSGAPRSTDAATPSAALLKAVLVNSAESMVGPLYDVFEGTRLADLDPAPNQVQGWGRVRLDRSLYFAGDAERLAVLCDAFGDGLDRGLASRPPLEQGELHTFGLHQVRQGTVLRVTLAWTDPAGVAGAERALVNDLDLEVEDPNGVIFRGNVALSGNRSSPANSLPPDDRNPLEQVLVDPGVGGDWLVRVRARSVPGNGRTSPYPSTSQGYALVAVGDFDAACLEGPCQVVDDGGQPADGDGEPDGLVPGDGDPGDGVADGALSDGDSAPDGVGEDGGQSDGGRLEGGCGCDSGGGGALWPVLGLLLTARRRRWRR